jgi:hypothetical protein
VLTFVSSTSWSISISFDVSVLHLQDELVSLVFSSLFMCRSLRRQNQFTLVTCCILVVVMGWDCSLRTEALGLLYYPRMIAMWATK